MASKNPGKKETEKKDDKKVVEETVDVIKETNLDAEPPEKKDDKNNFYINHLALWKGKDFGNIQSRMETVYAKDANGKTMYDADGKKVPQLNNAGYPKTKEVYKVTLNSEVLGHERNERGRYTKRIVIDGLTDSSIVPAYKYVKGADGKTVVETDANGEKVRATNARGQELYNVRGWDAYTKDDGTEKDGIKCVEQELVPKFSKTNEIIDYVWQNVKDENGNDKVYKFSEVAKAHAEDARNAYANKAPDAPTGPDAPSATEEFDMP